MSVNSIYRTEAIGTSPSQTYFYVSLLQPLTSLGFPPDLPTLSLQSFECVNVVKALNSFVSQVTALGWNSTNK